MTIIKIVNNLNKIKKIITFFIVLLFIFLIFFQVAKAGDKYGLYETANQAKLDTTKTNIPEIIGSVVGAGLAFIGVLFFILMVYGGYIWMMSGGNEQEAGKGKGIILAAIIGLIIVLAAYALTTLVAGIFQQVKTTGV